MEATKESLSGSDPAGPSTRRGHLGIPEAVFVSLSSEDGSLPDHDQNNQLRMAPYPTMIKTINEDVDAFMKQPGNESVDNVLKKLDEQYQKYKFMELNLTQKKKRLKNQIPEIRQTLHILKYMQKKKETTEPLETRFLLADNLYCKASVPPTDKVCLWLGANVMLEYDIDEARSLLEKNHHTATSNLESLEEDLDFLRDQFTTTEVNMARVYNWDVKRRNRDEPGPSNV